MKNDQIREIFLANGFTINAGADDLRPYVYQAARALLEVARTIAAPAQSVATIKRILIEQKLNDATGEPDDEAYNQAIDDCIAAIDETFEDAPVSTAAPVVPEDLPYCTCYTPEQEQYCMKQRKCRKVVAL